MSPGSCSIKAASLVSQGAEKVTNRGPPSATAAGAALQTRPLCHEVAQSPLFEQLYLHGYLSDQTPCLLPHF